MKKIIGLAMSVLLLTSMLFPILSRAEEQSIKVFINEEQLNFSVDPIIENGTTLVPFRVIFEKLGLNVGWEGTTRTVSGLREGLNLKLQIDNKVAEVNGESLTLLVAPKIINGNTFVPLRFVSEVSGASVEWDGKTKTILITTDVNEQLKNAIFENNIELVKELLILGANPNYVDKLNRTPLEWTVSDQKRNEILKVLLDNGADPNTKTELGFPMLLVATIFSNVDAVKILLEYGADSNAKDKQGKTTLENAKDQLNLVADPYKDKVEEIIKLLSEKGLADVVFNNAQDIELYLQKNYSKIHTKLTDVDLNIQVQENDSIYRPYDYYINFEYNIPIVHSYINSFKSSIKYADTGVQDAELSFVQIQEHIKKAAQDIISKMPDKKFRGNTQYEWYSYPHIKIDLNTLRENSWNNYEPIEPKDKDKTDKYYYLLLDYKETKVDTFKWVPEEDFATFDE